MWDSNSKRYFLFPSNDKFTSIGVDLSPYICFWLFRSTNIVLLFHLIYSLSFKTDEETKICQWSFLAIASIKGKQSSYLKIDLRYNFLHSFCFIVKYSLHRSVRPKNKTLPSLNPYNQKSIKISMFPSNLSLPSLLINAINEFFHFSDET